MSRVDFYFDCMSPYSYLAATRIEAMVGAAGGEVVVKPIYLPGVMRAAGVKAPVEVPAKLAYMVKDLTDWVTLLGLPPIVVPQTFPFSSALADRCALVAVDEGKGMAYAKAVLSAVWSEGADLNDVSVMSRVISSAGLDAAQVLERAGTDAVKQKLRAETEAAVERGIFGVPTFFVGDEMFVGNDRLDFVVRALRR